jgi:hypothetical protein
MIKLEIKNNQLTSDSIDLLNASVLVAMPMGLELHAERADWTVDFILGTAWSCLVPVIKGKLDDLILVPKYVIHAEEGFLELVSMTIDGPQLTQQINYKVTPLSEVYILAKLEDKKPEKRQVHSQLGACSNLIQEMYANDDDYDINKPVPKVFFTKLDLDYYLANLAVTLEESILLWMESTGRLSVNMNDDGINMPRRLEKTIKRVFMFGPARNKVKVEFNNGDQKDFSLMTPSAQLEICSEILSILPM